MVCDSDFVLAEEAAVEAHWVVLFKVRVTDWCCWLSVSVSGSWWSCQSGMFACFVAGLFGSILG